jgi:hypothetical protein
VPNGPLSFIRICSRCCLVGFRRPRCELEPFHQRTAAFRALVLAAVVVERGWCRTSRLRSMGKAEAYLQAIPFEQAGNLCLLMNANVAVSPPRVAACCVFRFVCVVRCSLRCASYHLPAPVQIVKAKRRQSGRTGCRTRPVRGPSRSRRRPGRPHTEHLDDVRVRVHFELHQQFRDESLRAQRLSPPLVEEPTVRTSVISWL